MVKTITSQRHKYGPELYLTLDGCIVEADDGKVYYMFVE